MLMTPIIGATLKLISTTHILAIHIFHSLIKGLSKTCI